MTLLRKCIHVSNEYELGRKDVSLQSFKYVTYDIGGGQERKHIQLVTSQVQVCDFMKDFIEKTQQYVQHVHLARGKDEHFRICRDTFPIGTVLSVVYFVETYTIQPKNEIQSQYYHLD
jgi:dTDP-D-glucose 4,6-dehydratase